jgi:adenylate cyclase
LKLASVIHGAVAALARQCRYVTIHIGNILRKNRSNLSPKPQLLCIYAGVLKPQLHLIAITSITVNKANMAIEIEHKFLLANDDWRQQVSHSVVYKQGYLSSEPTSSILVRISDTCAWLNIKSATIGTQRHEYEYQIPLSDALEILTALCKKPIIEKTRYFVRHNHHTWEIDEFYGENQGLIVAEIELSEQDQSFEKPSWLGEEVTHDKRYYNNNLAVTPYLTWDAA